MKTFIIFMLLTFLCNAAWAKTKPKKIFDHPKSSCRVEQFGGGNGGDYPTFKVSKSGKSVYSIDCDCSVSVLFSPSGKYIAFGNSEMDSFERKGNLLVFNCETGTKKTYILPGCSKESGPGVCIANYAIPKEWSKDEDSLNYLNYSDGKESSAKLIFNSENPRP